MSALLSECIKLGLRQVISVIGGGDSNVASIALHKKFGFELVGTFKGHRVWPDNILLFCLIILSI